MLPIDRRSDLLTQLSEGIVSLTTSDQWRRHLDCQRAFRHYSFGNVVLIAAQCPGASQVAGFHAWKKLGRSVRRGQTAIWILAPMVRRRTAEERDDDRPVRGFKYVAVFDLSQTEGEELPTVCQRLTGDEPAACVDGLTGVADALGYAVDVTELPDGVNGDCAFDLRRIRIEGRNSPAQQAKTLVHEIAHALLHPDEPDRRLAELEAESTAYVVCRSLGVDTAAYSFGYVASWAGDGERAVAGIKASGSRIQGAAAAILDRLETLATALIADAA
jgi:N-terminal domain of anti-restriction factor ArdC/IrrE N-terminal-like domain